MSFFGNFIGGAATTAEGIIQSEQDAQAKRDEQERLLQMSAELDKQKMIAAETLKEKFAQAAAQAKRSQDMSDAQTVIGKSTDTMNNRLASIINSKAAAGDYGEDSVGTMVSGEDVKDIANNPEALKAYGIIGRWRSQELGDKADAAMSIGRTDMEKGYRDQQNVEISSDREERKAAAAERRADILEQAQQEKAINDSRRTDLQEQRMFAAIANSGSKNGNTDFDKKVSLLKQAGASDKEVANFILERKQPSIEDLANGYVKSDPNFGGKNAITMARAVEMAKELRQLTSPQNTPESANQSGFKKGDTKVIAVGPNAGKTAVFDGTGWMLK